MRTNEQIRFSPIRVIDQENNQLGVIPTDEAMRLARDAGLDLVEVAPTERPPVCRIMDYGKFKYGQKKKQKRNTSHDVVVKEVRLRPKTDQHDRDTKVNHAKSFLDKGDKVQFTMLFRGRERAHIDIGMSTLKGIVEEFGEAVKVERPPRMEGSRMIMILAPAMKK